MADPKTPLDWSLNPNPADVPEVPKLDPLLTGIPVEPPQPVHTIEQVANSPEPLKAGEEYLQSKGFQTRMEGPLDYLSGGTLPALKNSLTALNLLLDPVVRGIQDEAGKPLVEAAIKHLLRPKQEAQGLTPGKGLAAGEELVARSVGMFVGGPAVLEGMPEKEKLEGVTALESAVPAAASLTPAGQAAVKTFGKEKVGEVGTAALLAGAQQVGEAPLFVVGPGKWVKLGEEAAAAKGLSKLGQVALKQAGRTAGGVRAGALSSVPFPERKGSEIAPGVTLFEGAVGGGAVGFGTGAASEGGAYAKTLLGEIFSHAKKPQTHAMFGQGEQIPDTEVANREVASLIEARGSSPSGKGRPTHEALVKKAEDIAAKEDPSRKGRTLAILLPGALDSMWKEIEDINRASSIPIIRPKLVAKKGEVFAARATFDAEGKPAVMLLSSDASGGLKPPEVHTIRDPDHALELRKWIDDMELAGAFTLSPEFLIAGWGHADPGIDLIARNLAMPLRGTKSKGRELGLQAVLDALHPKSSVSEKAEVATPSVKKRMFKERADRNAMQAKVNAARKVLGGEADTLADKEVYNMAKDLSEDELYDLVMKMEGRDVLDAPKPSPAFEVLAEASAGGRDTVRLKPVQQSYDRLPDERVAVFEPEVSKTDITPQAPYTDEPTLKSDPFRERNQLVEETSAAERFPREKTPVDRPKKGPPPGGGEPPKPPPPSGPKLLPPGSQLAVRGPEKLDIPAIPADYGPQYASTTAREAVDLAVQLMREKDKSFPQRALKSLVGAHQRGPTDLATLNLALKQASVVQKSSEEVFAALNRKHKIEFLGQLDRDLYDAFKGREAGGPRVSDALDKVFAKHPYLQQESKALLRNVFVEKELLDKQLQSLGYVPDDFSHLRESGMMDLYLARRYAAFASPKMWGKILEREPKWGRLQDAAEFLQKQMKEKPGDWGLVSKGSSFKEPPTVNKIVNDLFDILRAKDPVESFQTHATTKPFKSLLQKKNVPEPLRRLLGEIESGTFAISNSLGTQRAVLSRAILMDEIANRPDWSSNSPNVGLRHIYEVPAHPAFGPLAGKFVPEHIYEAIQFAPRSEAYSHQFLHNALGFVKGNQVALGGVGPMINNTMGNLWSGVLSGGLDWMRPMKSGRSLKHAFIALRDYYKDPTGLTGMGGVINEARRVGADFFGYGHEEIGNINSRRFTELLDDVFMRDVPPDLHDLWGRMNRKLSGNWRKLQMWGGDKLDEVDRLFRIQSYIALKEKFRADWLEKGDASLIVKEGLLEPRGGVDTRGRNFGHVLKTPNVVDREVNEAVARLAARRINQSFVNPTFLGSAPDKIRRSAVGWVTPYFTMAAETTRLNAMIPQRLMREPDLFFRLLGTAGIVGGAYGLARHFYSISDEEIQQAMDVQSKRSQYYAPAQIPLAFRDSLGRVQFWNATNHHDILRLLVGHADDPLAAKFLTNLFPGQFLEGGVAEQPYRYGLSLLGMEKPPMRSGDPDPTQSFFARLIRYGFQYSLLPGVLRGVDEGMRRGTLLEDDSPLRSGPFGFGYRRPFEEPLTPAQQAFRMMGGSNIMPVSTGEGSPSLTGSAMEILGENKDYRVEMKKIGGMKDTEASKERAAEAEGKFQKKASKRKRLFK